MPRLLLDDTIAALASAPGPGARGIIRISGAGVRGVLEPLFEAELPAEWRSSRRAGRYAGRIPLSHSTVPLPVDLYFWPNTRSYTGQPTAELHTVGSPPLLEALLEALYAHGARPARPGEFTLRAFLAGRLDLTQAEAVLGVIDAHDHIELETALRQLAGGLSGPIAACRSDLLDLLAELEAGLDFVEEDIEFIEQRELIERLASAGDFLRRLLEQACGRMQSTGRRRVVLAGLPNAGKSTLFNALAGREAALVSPVQGTTRDWLTAEVDWDGTAVELIDTAGWDHEADAIMRQAQTSRGEQFDRADLIVWCSAADFDPAARKTDARLRDALREQERPLLVVQTKCDLPDGAFSDGEAADLRISAATGTGLAELIGRVEASLSASRAGGRQFVGMTAARCRESLTSAVSALEAARTAAELAAGDEIVAIDVREALDHLGRILGAVYTDDVLDRIFSRFCIGK